MIHCNKCNTDKPTTEFYLSNRSATGYRTPCKVCIAQHRTKSKPSAASKLANKLNMRKRRAAGLSRNNKPKVLWVYSTNPTAIKVRALRAKRPAANRANAAKQKAAKLHRTVHWADNEFNQLVISEMYKQAHNLFIVSKLVHEVDHVIPLQGELVSGLHHYTNLQIITRQANRTKGNKYNT